MSSISRTLLVSMLACLLLLASACGAPETTSPTTDATPSGDYTTFMAQGQTLLQQDNLQEAAVQFEKAVQAAPNEVEGHFRLGNVYTQLGQLDEAREQFEQALDLDADNADAYSNLGVVYYELGQLDDAASAFKKALKLEPDDPEILYNLGGVYVQQNDLDGAITEFNKAIESNDMQPEPYFGLGNVYKLQGKNAQAIEALETFLKLAPESTWRPLAESLLKEMGVSVTGK